jgi:hypothetical protein
MNSINKGVYYLTEVEKIHDEQTDLIYYRGYYSNGIRQIDEIFEINSAIPTIIIK